MIAFFAIYNVIIAVMYEKKIINSAHHRSALRGHHAFDKLDKGLGRWICKILHYICISFIDKRMHIIRSYIFLTRLIINIWNDR